MIDHDKNLKKDPHRCGGEIVADRIQAAEMLNGAAGKLVGIGSASPSASALARRYISLPVAPFASRAAATTAQLRISVVIEVMVKDLINLVDLNRNRGEANRQ